MVAPVGTSHLTGGSRPHLPGDATSPNSTVASTTWTFGDGQTANGTTISHSYAADRFLQRHVLPRMAWA
ncbi:MAG: PKD domain-containing protein [Holophagaceae bacterium]|nr:PKD domain-containing protein [Holophagaceae bacterium]